MKKTELQDRIKELEYKIDHYDPDETQFIDQYETMLDESYDDYHMGGCTYAPSQVLKAVDPVAYREGLLNYIDSLIKDRDIPELQELQEELDDLQDQLNELES